MLRELNLNEMESVSGGEDEVVVTAQRRSRERPEFRDVRFANPGGGAWGGADGLSSSALSGLEGAFGGSGGQTIGSFTVNLGEANSTMEVGDTTVNVITQTNIEIEVVIPENNEGHAHACLETPLGCLRIYRFPND